MHALRRALLRVGTVTAILVASLPVLGSVASAAPVVTISPATITYTDTSAADTFTEVRGTASSSSAVSIDGGSNALPNPPNTATIFYTSGKVGSYGTLWMQSSGAWLYEPNIRAVNGATTTVTDTFTLRATDGSGSGTQDLVVTVNGVEDTPALTVSTKTVADVTDDMSVSVICGTTPGSGDPYQIDVGSSPSSERCHNAFDNSTGTKYLNFTRTNSSVLIDLKRAWTITKAGFTTANDAIERDPTAFDLYGSNTSTSADMVLIRSVTGMSPPSGRFVDYSDVDISAAAAFRYLKLTFTNVRTVGSACCVQVAEIRLSGTTVTSPYTEGDPAMSVEPTLLLADDNTASATVTVTSGFTTGDVLSFTNDGSTMGTIAGSWNAGTGQLSLTGSATVVQWQNALRAVKYSTSNVNPTAISTSRTITWSVTDSASRNTTATSTFPVIAINSVPVLGGAAPVAVGTSTTTVFGPDLTVSDNDSADMNGGVLTVSGATTGDVVSIDSATSAALGAIRTSGSSIQRYDGSSWVTIGTVAGGSASTYTVTFSSAAVTPAVAQSVIRAVRLAVDATARTRTLSVTISDGDGGTSSAVSVPVTSSSGVAASIALEELTDTGKSSSDLVTRAMSLVFDVNFSTAITGLTSGDFAFFGTATGCTATPSGDTAPITVTVDGCSAGTVILTLSAGAVQGAADNTKTNETVSAPTVTIDRTAPTITISTSTASPTRSLSLSFALSAGESLNCATVAQSDFALTNISGIGAVATGSNSCSFSAQSSVATGTSAASSITASGSFGVADIAGNVATTATGSPSVTVDRTVPSVTSVSLSAASDTGESSSDRVTNASSLVFTVAFSESVVGIAATDFRNSGTAENCSFAASVTSGISVVVTVTGCGEGTLVPTVKQESLSGANGDGPSAEYSWSAVTIDRSGPARTSLSPADDSVDVARGANMVITFDEVVHRKTGNVVVYGPAASAFATMAVTASQITGTGTNTITINPSSDLGAGGNYYVNIPSTALADVAGNLYAGITNSTTWNFRSLDNLAPATSLGIVATEVQSTSVTLTYSATEEGTLATVDAWYSTAADLSGAVLCGTTSSSSLTGSVTCTIPDVLGTYYFFSRGTDAAGNIEAAPGSADDSVALTDPVPVSSVTAPGTTRNRTVTVTYSASDNGTVTSIQVWYSAAANLSSPVSCATKNSPGASGTVSCTLPSTQATYYLFSRATDNRNQTETAPGSADATVIYSNSRPASAVTASASVTVRNVTVGYTASDDGSVDSVTVYYSTAANLSSPVSCATIANPAASGNTTCRLPVTPDTYYLFSRATDDDGQVELVPGSADATVTYTNARPSSSVTGPATTGSRTVTLTYSTSDDGSVGSLTVYYSTAANLSTPVSCGSQSNPGASGSVVCTLPNTNRTYYVWSLAVDDQDREETDPLTADATIELNVLASSATTFPVAVVTPGTGGTGDGLAGSPVATVPTATTAVTTTTVAVSRSPKGKSTTGPTTTATSTATTTTTTLPPTAGVPMVKAGEAAIVSNGETKKVEVTRENNAVRFQWSQLWAVIKALDKNGTPIGLDVDGNIRLTAESKVEVAASGFKPQSNADAWLFSKPVRIGTAVVGADGKTSGVFSLPKKVDAGSHRIVLLGLDPAGKQVKFTLGIKVVEPPTPASRTVIVVLIITAIAIALFIPPVRRRRRLPKRA